MPDPSCSSLDSCRIPHTVQFLLFFLTFKPLNSQAPSYLSDLLQLYVPSRQLLSYTTLLRLPSAHLKSSGRRAFLYQEPLLWNNLPCSLRHSSFTALSKSAFQTHLFPLDYELFASVRICVHLCAIGFACVCVCVCVCVYARARVRAFVRACVRVCVWYVIRKLLNEVL